MIPVIYSNLCPVCGKDLTAEEIENKMCFNIKESFYKESEELKEFLEFFKKCVGELREIQKMWAKRILRGESFAATAPTGIGKTSFGIIISMFYALKKKRSYLIFPTSLLIKQAIEDIKEYSKKLTIPFEEFNIGYYLGDMSKKEKEDFFNNLSQYNIIITTTQFLSKHYQQLGNFNFIFVDDVDSILKASKNVERLLSLLGFKWNPSTRKWEGKKQGTLMVSTATGKKGKKAQLFRELLDFDIGSSRISIRNIEDIVINSESLETIINILKKFGKGGIIYARSTEEAERIYEKLKDKFRIGIITSTNKKDYDRFANKELDYLIGTAYYYGSLVRGLDLPERIRFALFIGAPSFRIKIKDVDNLNPRLLRTLGILYSNIPEISKIMPKLDKQQNAYEQLKLLLKQYMKDVRPKVKDVVIRDDEIIFPDIKTYIQGSGRTSRLLVGGLTKGASFLLEKDTEVLKAFIERAKYYDIHFKTLQEINVRDLIKEIDETRKKERMNEKKDFIKPALFIVESPTKAKQISRFFGRPSIKVLKGSVVYEIPTEKYVLMVTASLGHIADLITNKGFHGVEIKKDIFIPIYASIKKCNNCLYQFTEETNKCPRCGSSDIIDSKERINSLRKLAQDAGLVIIGTDPDTEGEKIAWDIKNLLTGYGEIKRAEFHEVTKRAIMEALSSLRDVKEDLVKAQIVRRIEDRWIGFTLSQKLWKMFNNHNLSAGRAQTPVLGWIIKRNEESHKKKTIAIIKEMGLVLEHDKKEFDLKISLKEKKEEMLNPLPPYTTDTLLRDANLILKFSAKHTMQLAQELFENGLITYHRTDSTHVSERGREIAKEFLGDYFYPRIWGEKGAHECIRPTRAIDKDNLQRLIREEVIMVNHLTWQHFALYDLIFRRFMASQSPPVKANVEVYEIEYDGKRIEEKRVTNVEGEAYKLYKFVWIKDPLPIGEHHVKAQLKKVPIVMPFSQSEIIQTMKEKGIGRPSTYATIVDRLFIRKYVIEKNNKIFPTKRGIEVYNYLANNYGEFVSEERTRQLEKKMDAVEKGEMDYIKVLTGIYKEISKV